MDINLTARFGDGSCYRNITITVVRRASSHWFRILGESGRRRSMGFSASGSIFFSDELAREIGILNRFLYYFNSLSHVSINSYLFFTDYSIYIHSSFFTTLPLLGTIFSPSIHYCMCIVIMYMSVRVYVSLCMNEIMYVY